MVGEATKGARPADLSGGDGEWTGKVLRVKEATLVTALRGPFGLGMRLTSAPRQRRCVAGRG